MNFSLQKDLELSGVYQYKNYLANTIYIDRLKKISDDPINYQLVEIRNQIAENNYDQKLYNQKVNETNLKQFDNLTHKIFGKLDKGFNNITDRLDNINSTLDDINFGIESLHEAFADLYSLLDWKTEVLIEQLKLTNYYLGNIVELMKIPDSQKQRGYYVEQGTGYLINAFKEENNNSSFYADAFEEFNKALIIEKRDFFSLNKLGLIYLNSLNHLNIEEAQKCFLESAKYSKAQSNIAKTYDELSYQDNKFFYSKEFLINETADSFNLASRTAYILENYTQSIEFSNQAISLVNTNPDFYLQLAKSYSKIEKENEAVNAIIKSFELNKFYSIKVLSDNDFLQNSKVLELIEKYFSNYISSTEKTINYLKSAIVVKSIVYKEFDFLIQKMRYPNYIDCVDVNDKLNEVKKRTLNTYSYEKDWQKWSFWDKSSKNYKTGITVIENKSELSLSDFIKAENVNYKGLPEYELNDKRILEERDNYFKELDRRRLNKKISRIFFTIVLAPLLWLLTTLHIDSSFYLFIAIILRWTVVIFSIRNIYKFYKD